MTITYKGTAGPATQNATSYNSANLTFTTGRMYILVVLVTGAANDGVVTSASNTWDAAGSVGDVTRRIQAFTTISTTTITEQANYNTFGSTATGFAIGVFEVTGFTTSSGVVKQVAYGGATGSDPSITMASLNPNSGVFSAFMSNTNPFGGTPETGWTEHIDGGYDTPTAGTYFMYRGSTTDNTPTVTAASSTWIGLAIEIAANKRRITQSNW